MSAPLQTLRNKLMATVLLLIISAMPVAHAGGAGIILDANGNSIERRLP